MDIEIYNLMPNTALEATAFGVISSAVAGDGFLRRASAFVR
jgi:hypothetical protein